MKRRTAMAMHNGTCGDSRRYFWNDGRMQCKWAKCENNDIHWTIRQSNLSDYAGDLDLQPTLPSGLPSLSREFSHGEPAQISSETPLIIRFGRSLHRLLTCNIILQRERTYHRLELREDAYGCERPRFILRPISRHVSTGGVCSVCKDGERDRDGLERGWHNICRAYLRL